MYYNKDRLNKFEKELLIMTLDDDKELEDVSKGNKEMEDVLKKIKKVSRQEELQGIYDIEQRNEFIKNRIRNYAREEGYYEGYDKGIENGRKDGIKEIAKNLLKENVDVNIISLSTGLSKEEIEKLG